MSNYIPRTQKKRERQARVESDLRRLASKNAPLNKLKIAAEKVRAARIRTICADRQHCVYIGSEEHCDKQIAVLRSMSINTILIEFGISNSDLDSANE